MSSLALLPPEAAAPDLLAAAAPAPVPISSTLSIPVDASRADVLGALALADPAALAALPLPRDVEVRWDSAVRLGAEGSVFLAIRTRFQAGDRRAHERLLDAWGTISPLAAALTRRAAAAVKAAAEEDGAQ